MLTWIWFAAFVAGALTVSWRGGLLMADEEADSFGWLNCGLAAMLLLCIALWFASDRIIVPTFNWLAAALPETGTTANLVTAGVVVAIGCFAFAVALPFGVMTLPEYWRSVAKVREAERKSMSLAKALLEQVRKD